LKTLDRDMVLNAVKHPDAVGHGVWMIDIHDPKGTGYTTYTDRNDRSMLKEGTSYHIPLGMALNDRIPNLAVACRAASSTHEAHASIRVQAHLMALAQGVGTCAALALDSGVDMVKVDIKKLQKILRDDGVYLEDVPS
ncbi:MAG: FAD-dependent oxidoreductase, partial [Kiritimatiellae bacterium]|nr:FAD-dependent oxidoreductase [Kiritimatiellia bacterium]